MVRTAISNRESGPGEFWNDLASYGRRVAVIDGKTQQVTTYEHLAEGVRFGAKQLAARPKGLCYLAMHADVDGILCYLSLLAAGHVTYLASADPAALTPELLERYRPDFILWRGMVPPALHGAADYIECSSLFGYSIAQRASAEEEPLHSTLALLMSTSGSTGSAKVARLSAENVAVNAWQNRQVLRISERTRSALTLPMHYAYGLSVLNSSLASGASLLLQTGGIMNRHCWQACQSHAVTNLPLVPAQLKLMREAGFQQSALSGVASITVAAAAMDDGIIAWILDHVVQKGIQVFSMYGMTEATARISVLSPDEFADNPRSVGMAVPGGRLEVLNTGEVVYRGPNVMLGYAHGREELRCADENRGVLKTGDLGAIDGAGRLFITGRLNRISKLLGLRISHSEVESKLATLGPVAVTGDDAQIQVFHTASDERPIRHRMDWLAREMRIPPHVMVAIRVEEIPRTETGKTCYARLSDQAMQQR